MEVHFIQILLFGGKELGFYEVTTGDVTMSIKFMINLSLCLSIAKKHLAQL